MSYVRKRLTRSISASYMVRGMKDGARVKVAGLVIRRQRPVTSRGVIFVTLDDEFGHVPLVVWPKEYQKYRAIIKQPLLLVDGFVSRREGTMNVVVQGVESIAGQLKAPESKDWG